MQAAKTLYEFDNCVMVPLHNFRDADDYYEQSKLQPCLTKIRIPTYIIQALDDPIVDPDAIPQANDLGPSLRLLLTKYGGHVGFISCDRYGLAYRWLDQTICQILRDLAF